MNAGLIISIIVCLLILYSGYRNGLFSTAATLLMLTVSIAISIEAYAPIVRTGVLKGIGDYAEPVSLTALFVVALFMMQMIANIYAPPTVHMRRATNKFGGLGLSVVTAIITSGFLGLVVCMTPWTGLEQGQRFIGMDAVSNGIGHMTRCLGGKIFDNEGELKRLRRAENERICYRNLEDILVRLSDIYRAWDNFAPLTQQKLGNAVKKGTLLPIDGAAEGTGVGENGMACPCSGKRYELKLIQNNEIPYGKSKAIIQAYDTESCHEENGAKVRMVLLTWQDRDEARRNVRVYGKVELMPEEKFQAMNAAEH